MGRERSHFFEDLYEQCSFHMAENIPSSVNEGSLPIISSTRAYSSSVSPWAAITSGVMAGSVMRHSPRFVRFRLHGPLSCRLYKGVCDGLEPSEGAAECQGGWTRVTFVREGAVFGEPERAVGGVILGQLHTGEKLQSVQI